MSDAPKPRFPLAGVATDGWSNEQEATATCLCGAVQLVFPVQGPGYINSFVCNCSDCHKITASMFASNLTVKGKYLRQMRGELKTFAQAKTIDSGNTMTNYFCPTCGTLMYRRSSGGGDHVYMRIGTVDDFSLHDTKLKPDMELFTKDRVSWFTGVKGAEQYEGMPVPKESKF